MNKRKTFQLQQKRAKQRTEFRQREDNLDRSGARDPGNFKLPDIGSGGSGPCQHPCEPGVIQGGDCVSATWRIPIDVKFKMRVNATGIDKLIETQILVTRRSSAFGGSGSSWCGLLLQNLTDQAPEMWMFTNVGGGDTGTGFWDGNPAANGDGVLVAASGGLIGNWFWYRFRLEDSQNFYCKAWLDGTSEPASWQLHQFPDVGQPDFDPINIDWLWLYFEANQSDVSYDVDEIHITEGYGDNSLVETFSRSETSGWGISEINPNESWDNDPLTNPLDPFGVDGSNGFYDFALFSGGDATTIALYLPRSSSGPCVDDFERSLAPGGWGTGGLGEWQTADFGGIFEENLSVDGDRGTFELQDSDLSPGYVWVNGKTNTPPIELLLRWAVAFNWDSTNIEWTIQMDGSPSPVSSTDWLQIFLDFVNTTGTFASHSFSLDFSLQSSEGDFDESLAMFSQGPFENDEYARWELWTRARIDEDGTCRARIWEDGSEEPGTWTLVGDPASMAGKVFPNVGHLFVPESDGINFSTFEHYDLQIIEGCVDDCLQDLATQEGGGTRVVIEGDLGEPPTGGVYSRVVLGVCTRVTGTSYTTPTHASSVINITLDGQDVVGWTFAEPNVITLPTSVDFDSRVYARYVMA